MTEVFSILKYEVVVSDDRFVLPIVYDVVKREDVYCYNKTIGL